MTHYFLATVFFLLSGLALSAIPFAVRDGYKTWPIYQLSMVLLAVGIACAVWR
jgi:hypothetical protein